MLQKINEKSYILQSNSKPRVRPSTNFNNKKITLKTLKFCMHVNPYIINQSSLETVILIFEITKDTILFDYNKKN